MSNPERTTTRVHTEGKSGQRVPLVSRGLFIGLALTAVYIAWEETGKPNPNELFIEPITSKLSLESTRDLHGKPIEGEEVKILLTDRFEGSDYDFVPVRSDPTRSDSNIIGWAPFEQEVIAEAYYGVTYPGGSLSGNGLGQIKGPDSKIYGKWYFIHQIDVFVLDENGQWQLRPRFNVFVGGNYLKPLEAPVGSSLEN